MDNHSSWRSRLLEWFVGHALWDFSKAILFAAITSIGIQYVTHKTLETAFGIFLTLCGLIGLAWTFGVLRSPTRKDKTPPFKKINISPASSEPCIEVNANRGEITVRLSVFSCIPDLRLLHVSAGITTGNEPDAVTFDHNEPKSIEHFDRTRIEFSKRLTLEEKKSLGDAGFRITLKGMAYFRTGKQEIERDFRIVTTPRRFPEPFAWV